MNTGYTYNRHLDLVTARFDPGLRSAGWQSARLASEPSNLMFRVLILIYLKARMGQTGFFWCEHIVTSPKNVKTLHKQIIADIY